MITDRAQGSRYIRWFRLAILRGRRARWFSVALSGVVLALYLPSLRFGLIWDDPSWYRQGMGLSIAEIMTSLSTFQFYRPLTVLLSHLFVSPSGVVHVRAAHLVQVMAHLAATLALLAALPTLGLRPREARLAALVFAVHPFSYQAVAWQAAHQPMALAVMLLAYLAAERYTRRREGAWLALSAVLYGAALLLQESAVPFVLLFAWLALRQWRSSRRAQNLAWPVIHLALAAAFVALWIMAPRRGGITGEGFDLTVLAYLLQGVAFPAARAIAALGLQPSDGLLMATMAAAWLGLGLATWGRDRARSGLLASALIILGLAPVWAGLSWPYVRVGSRLLYPATAGIAALWGRWLAWGWPEGAPVGSAAKRHMGARRAIGLSAAATVIALSLGQWARFQRLYAVSAAHQAEAVAAMTRYDGGRLMFVNYPDRLELAPPLYPLGYWGLTLAPADQPLSGFALATTGRAAEAPSFSAFFVGATERKAWPYRVDMRGEGRWTRDLFAEARACDAIYLTDYLPGGRLALRRVGAVGADEGGGAIARFSDRVELLETGLANTAGGDGLRLELVWRAIQPAADEDTIFVHLLTEAGLFVAAYDGDAAAGLLPMSDWEPGLLITDVREIPLAGVAPGDYVLSVGVYHRLAGRYAAVAAGGRVPDDELVLHRVTVGSMAR